MSNLVKMNSRVSGVCRVYTIACGLLLSLMLVGCVDPEQPFTETPWEDRVWLDEPDNSSATADGVQSDAEIEVDAALAKPDSGDRADAGAATEPQKVSTPSSDSPANEVSGEPPKSPEETAGETAGEPAPAAAPQTAAAVMPAPSVVPPEPEKPAIDDDPERLMGLGTGELTRMLGDPRFVRRDASAQLWRYRNTSCILDLFLYRNADRPGFVVSHVEARRSAGGAVHKRECFGALLLEQLDREAG